MLGSLRTDREWLTDVAQRLTPLAQRPTLLLCGRHDNGTAAGFVDRWAQLLPNHRREILEDAGHFPAEDEPEDYAEAIDRFMARPDRE